MSDTPRTDEFALSGKGHLFDQDDFDFCAGLERELKAMTKRADEMERLKEHNGEMFYRAERERDNLKAKFKAAFEMPHDWNGLCPDSVAGMDSRDPDCAACRALMEVFDAT